MPRMTANQRAARKMVRNASDEMAISRYGAEFDNSRADHICDFIEGQLVLYEGELAGKPFKLMDWQRDYIRRCFGWVIFDEFYDRWVRRFKKAMLWVPKKNGKSPLCAAVGIYLFLMDGEHGQKVYSAARTGAMAKQLVHKHAVKMIQKAGFTAARIVTLNKSTQAMTFAAMDSEYVVLAGDNIRAQEGHNGSVCLDEAHVVDGRLARVLEHMGASRSEPLTFGVSTAGNDPDSWGKSQFDYGQRVADGEVDDPEYLFQYFGVPQNATDEDCRKEENWIAANPSIGTTLNIRELRSSARRAQQQGAADWADWKMYRLNQWQMTSTPWLDSGDWDTCGADFRLDDFAGEPVGLGLDLSDVKDSTCLFLTFNREGRWYGWPFFWLTEHYVKKFEHAADFRGFVEDGHLTICPGRRIDYEMVKNKIREVAEQFAVQRIAYDRYHASELARWWQEDPDLAWPDDEMSFEFPQTITYFASPTSEVESHVINGSYRHPDNRMLNWQAKHCQVWMDANRNKRPVKPKDPTKKIDGMVAAIMSFWSASQGESEPQGTFYENNRLEFI